MRLHILAATALALSLAACGDSADSGGSGGGTAPAPASQMTAADCKDPGSAMSYLDQRQKKLMDDVKANKTGIGETFNAFLAVVQTEADKAKAGGSWADYCKAIDAHLTGAGY